jgi:hypothetical protein
VASNTDDDADFSDAFCEFLQRSISTVDAAELLLLLYSHRDIAWEPTDLVARLEPVASLSVADTATYLELFRQHGLAVRGDGERLRFEPASAALETHVRTLARLYNERPVTLIRVIYALQDKKIKTFADAFKFWRS